MLCFSSQVCNGMNNFRPCSYSYNCFAWNTVYQNHTRLDPDHKIYPPNPLGNDNYMIQENSRRGSHVYMFLSNIHLHHPHTKVRTNLVDTGTRNFQQNPDKYLHFYKRCLSTHLYWCHKLHRTIRGHSYIETHHLCSYSFHCCICCLINIRQHQRSSLVLDDSEDTNIHKNQVCLCKYHH